MSRHHRGRVPPSAAVVELVPVPGEASGTIIPPEGGSEGAALERRHRPPVPTPAPARPAAPGEPGAEAGQVAVFSAGCGFVAGLTLATVGFATLTTVWSWLA